MMGNEMCAAGPCPVHLSACKSAMGIRAHWVIAVSVAFGWVLRGVAALPLRMKIVSRFQPHVDKRRDAMNFASNTNIRSSGAQTTHRARAISAWLLPVVAARLTIMICFAIGAFLLRVTHRTPQSRSQNSS